MPVADYLLGLVVFAAMLGFAGAAAWCIVQRRWPDLRGAERLLALAMLATVALLAALIGCAAVGLLRSGWVLVAGVLMLGAARRIPPGERAPEPPLRPAPSSRTGWLAVALAGSGLGAQLLAHLVEQGDRAIVQIDALIGPLPSIAGWVRSGSLWRIDQFDPGLAQANYPQNGTFLQLATILPWHNDALVRFSGVPLLALAGVAIYALALRLGTDRASGALVGLLVVSIPVVLRPAVVSLGTDILLVWALSTALVFLLRHRSTGRTGDLVVAGLSLGVAFGTKWYGVPGALILTGLWLAAGLVFPPGRRSEVLRSGGLLLALILGAGGVWLLRNLVLSGNPLFPAPLSPLGVELFPAPPSVIRDEFGFTVAHYLSQPRVLFDVIRPALTSVLGPGGVLLLAALPATVFLRRRVARGPARARVVAGLAAAGAVLAVAYVLTPDSALGPEGAPVLVAQNARYLVPALLPAAGVLAALLATTSGSVRTGAQLLLALMIIDGTRRVFYPVSGLAATPFVAIQAAVLCGVLLAALALVRRTRVAAAMRRGFGSPLGRAAVPACLLVILGVGGFFQQRAFNETRYRGFDAGIDWVLDQPPGQRVGIVGTVELGAVIPVYPAAGPRLGNAVFYLGPLREELLSDYRSRTGFLTAVRERQASVVLVGRGRPARPEVVQEQWLEASGYCAVARSAVLTVFAREALGRCS